MRMESEIRNFFPWINMGRASYEDMKRYLSPLAKNAANSADQVRGSFAGVTRISAGLVQEVTDVMEKTKGMGGALK